MIFFLYYISFSFFLATMNEREPKMSIEISFKIKPCSLAPIGVHLDELSLRFVREITDEIGECVNLDELGLFRCGPLPASAARLQSLRVLRVLRSAITSLPVFTMLKLLSLEDVPFLTSLPADLGSCKQLESITIFDASLLTELPVSVSELTALKRLSLRAVPRMETLPAGLGLLPELDSIIVVGSTPLLDPFVAFAPKLGMITHPSYYPGFDCRQAMKPLRDQAKRRAVLLLVLGARRKRMCCPPPEI